MFRYASRFFALTLVAATLACSAATAATSSAVTIPDPTVDAPLTTAKGEEVAVFAGGCFWGVEAVFEHVKGVKGVTSGYTGGAKETADYETVSDGRSGHAESVRITYDPSQISYGRLLKVFFSVAHNPTELNRQGPDSGTQYRSAIFSTNADQQRIARAYVAQLTEAKSFARPIVTQIAALNTFYEAEEYHQNYATLNPNQGYIVQHDLPKVENLRKLFPELYVTK